MLMNVLCVALGGGLGAVGRYLLGLLPLGGGGGLPLTTLIINFIGAVAIGFLAGLADRVVELPAELRLFLQVGVCGGFTTFSTFSLEMFNLLSAGRVLLGVTYAALSVVLCLLGVWLGRSAALCLGR